MMYAMTPSENARSVRAELEAIVAALRGDELLQLVVLGRRLMDASEDTTERDETRRRAF